MTRGFDANVPARKPRTKLSRVISELTSGSVAGADDGKQRSAVDEAAPGARDPPARARAPATS